MDLDETETKSGEVGFDRDTARDWDRLGTLWGTKGWCGDGLGLWVPTAF